MGKDQPQWLLTDALTQQHRYVNITFVALGGNKAAQTLSGTDALCA